MFEWYEKLTKKFPKKVVGDIIVAKSLFFMAIGSWLGYKISFLSTKILWVITFLFLIYVYGCFISWHQKKQTTSGMQITGLLALYLLMLFFGMQQSSAQWWMVLTLSGVFFLLALYHTKK